MKIRLEDAICATIFGFAITCLFIMMLLTTPIHTKSKQENQKRVEIQAAKAIDAPENAQLITSAHEIIAFLGENGHSIAERNSAGERLSYILTITGINLKELGVAEGELL